MASTTLGPITEAMRDHDRTHAPGSESAQWQEYCEATCDDYGTEPYADGADDITVDAGWAEFWMAVAARDYTRAATLGHVPEEWDHATLCRSITSAPDLDELCEALKAASDAGVDTGAYDVTSLPLFVGPVPEDGIGIYSWDETRYLTCGDYGTRSDGGWCLVPREEWVSA